jgi:hypothetical protein
VHQDWDRDRDDWGGVQTIGSPGMSLRDYFAAKAMHAMTNNPTFTSYAELSEHAYLQADAMLKAREAK